MCHGRQQSQQAASIEISGNLHRNEGTDLLLGHFAKTHLESLSDQQLDDFEALLDAGDDRIHAWVMGNEPVPAAYDTKVFELIKRFK